ncbi:MAG: [protein-PII] uridylyltransferase [Desulfuromonadales bacterium]|nr:[protein-PII] uridylyltransferase [Desulfuromonadales bacterium]
MEISPDIAINFPDNLFAADLSFAERRPALCAAGRSLLDASRADLLQRHRNGASGKEIVRDYTLLIDQMIVTLFRAVSVDFSPEIITHIALVATGGYGRAELNPRSDIDIMFLTSGRAAPEVKTVSERLLYLLWDLGLDVGHSLRTNMDCLEVAAADVTVRTSLLDSRFLTGDKALFNDYEKNILPDLLGKNSQKFIDEKLEERNIRRSKYESTVYLLEPNIKEGEGGLRDLHAALWIARVKFKAKSLKELVIKGVISEQEAAAYRSALEHLWRLRNELHFLSPRKNEQLNFDHQEKIAHFFGFRDTRKAPAVEQFMQDYYFQATQIEHLASNLINRATQTQDVGTGLIGRLGRRQLESYFYTLRSELRLSRSSLFETEPEQMMNAFLLSHRHQIEISIELKGLIRANLHRINDKVRRDKIMSGGFLEILRTLRPKVDVLHDMHHLQFLNYFIPEFRRIYCKVQHDAYHIFTVDIHSILALQEIAKLWDGVYTEKKPLLTRLAGDIGKRELLMLAVLLHDIGKGEGKNHADKGADMIPTISRRFGLNREDSNRLAFLVRHHLDMAHISQRRDLNDDKLIDQFARTMEMTETLKMLYLLTFADIKAVGPEVWTEWKGFLLQDLYVKTYHVLERGNFRYDARSDRVRERKRNVVVLLSEEFGERKVKSTLKSMNNRYLLSHSSAEIAQHIRLALGRKGETLALQVDHDAENDFTQVVLSTVDVPGLFSTIAGVMSANGINILGAHIYTRSNGEALDILEVRGQTGSRLENPKKWEKVERDLNAAIEGRKSVAKMVANRKQSSLLFEKPKPRFADRVEIDNEISDQYTVIDLYTSDEVGLLYKVTRTLADMGLYIGVAMISTKVDQVADTFYVQDIFSQKIRDEKKLEEIRIRLHKVLAGDIENVNSRKSNQ